MGNEASQLADARPKEGSFRLQGGKISLRDVNDPAVEEPSPDTSVSATARKTSSGSTSTPEKSQLKRLFSRKSKPTPDLLTEEEHQHLLSLSTEDFIQSSITQFRTLDSDGSGELDVNEVSRAMSWLGTN